MNEAGREELGPRPPARQRNSISSFLFITFLLFMFTSHNGDELLARHQYQDALKSLNYQLSNYTAWINGTSTNFTVPDQNHLITPLMDVFNIRGGHLDEEKSSYYSNITGFVHGSTRLYNLTIPVVSEDDVAPWYPIAKEYMAGFNSTERSQRLGNWNWNASEKLAVSIVENLPQWLNGNVVSDNISLAHGRIQLTDIKTSEDLRLEFEGVHFLSDGLIYGFAQPNGGIDIRMLPSLVPLALKNETAQLIEPELNLRIKRLRNLIDAGSVDKDGSDGKPPKSTCSFTFYAQIHPSHVPRYLMEELEQEIQKPTGAWTIDPPKLAITALLISKECGIMYEIVDTKGLRSRTFFRKVTSYAGTAGLVSLTLLILHCRQVERSRTPSGLSRLSRWSFLVQATIDCVSFAGHITFAILADGRPSLALTAPAFLACILFFYEAQFSVLLYQIQAPENVIVPQVSPTSQVLPQQFSGNLGNANSPLMTDNRAPPPLASPAAAAGTGTQRELLSHFAIFTNRIRTDPQARLWIIFFIFSTFVVRIILSQTLSMIFVTMTYSLIWLPQIVRSVRRGRSSGLSWEYVAGTTTCRLFIALYFLACPKNVLDFQPRRWTYYPLTTLVCLQACLVILQDVFGPFFFLPERFKKVDIYDYHPPLPNLTSDSGEQSPGDCAICLDAIVVDCGNFHSKKGKGEEQHGHCGRDSREVECDLESASDVTPRRRGLRSVRLFGAMDVVATNARKNYSLAPCNHLFHTECLERWLAIKNICPQCRRPLPPF